MWQEDDHKLKKLFVFKNFKQAFAFMTEAAQVAEDMDHHPWWSNVYNKVDIQLYTFDAGNTITKRDRKLAEAIDLIFEKYQPESQNQQGK